MSASGGSMKRVCLSCLEDMVRETSAWVCGNERCEKYLFCDVEAYAGFR